MQALFHKRITHYQYDKLWCGKGNYTVFLHESLCPYHNVLQVTVIPSYLFLFFFPFVFSSENLAKDVSGFTKVLNHTIIAYFQKSFTALPIIVLQFVLITHVIFVWQLSISLLSESVYVVINAILSCKKLRREYKHTV